MQNTTSSPGKTLGTRFPVSVSSQFKTRLRLLYLLNKVIDGLSKVHCTILFNHLVWTASQGWKPFLWYWISTQTHWRKNNHDCEYYMKQVATHGVWGRGPSYTHASSCFTEFTRPNNVFNVWLIFSLSHSWHKSLQHTDCPVPYFNSPMHGLKRLEIIMTQD